MVENYESLSAYCMFLGYPRSGHSLVGALLNAHRNVVISHELDALSYIKDNISRDDLFEKIISADKNFVMSGAQWREYNYKVPDQWQGKYKNLKIIGDKKGGRTALLLQNFPELFSKLENCVNLPVRVIHVVRNPFDNIATMSVKNKLTLDKSVAMHIARCDFIYKFMRSYPAELFVTVRHEHLISSPVEELKKLCTTLGLAVDEEYLEACACIVFDSPSRTRHRVVWHEQAINSVNIAISRIPFLDGYAMDS